MSTAHRERVALTHRFCEQVKPLPKEKEYLDGRTRLALRVTPSGAKSWTMRYRDQADKQQRFTLGAFPEVSLAEARTGYLKASLELRLGLDIRRRPLDDAHDAQPAPDRTVGTVAQEFMAACEAGKHKPRVRHPLRPASLRLHRRALKLVLPAAGDLELSSVTRSRIQKLVNDVERDVAPSTARSVKKFLHSMYNYAIWKEYAATNPCLLVSFPPCGERDVILSDRELGQVWSTFHPPIDIPRAPVSPGMGYAILLAIVLLQRIGEVAQMRLSQINFEENIWEIPATLTKNHRHHVVPLPPLAIKLIKKALAVRTKKTDPVFPGHRDRSKPIGRTAPTHALTRVRRALSWSHKSLHDLRRTGSTNLAKPPLKISPFVISKILNHASDTGGAAGVTAVYNRYEYLDEKTLALRSWEHRLLKILSDQLGESAPCVAPYLELPKSERRSRRRPARATKLYRQPKATDGSESAGA